MAMATHIPAVLCRPRIPLMAAASVVSHRTVFLSSRSIGTSAMRLGTISSSVMGQRLVSVDQLRRGFSCGRVNMALKSGIVGLPNVGKSTLFNALVENGKAQAANFPFCTIEPNVGLVAVPDPRLEVLSNLSKSQKIVPTSVEFVDIAGLVKGASQGEGLGNKFLSHVREVDCILQIVSEAPFIEAEVLEYVGRKVVRCFEDNDIIHVNGKVDPEVDIDIINLELAFADMSQIEKRLERLKKGRAKDPQVKAKEEIEIAALQRINEALLNGQPARMVPLSEEESKVVLQLCLLTMKPVIFAANVAESELVDASGNPHVDTVKKCAAALNAEVVVVSAQVEAELTELDPEERSDYLQSLGVSESGLGSLVLATYNLLGLRTYFTSGEKETRAWTILAGMTAPQAAGVIHTDSKHGFIRAETVTDVSSNACVLGIDPDASGAIAVLWAASQEVLDVPCMKVQIGKTMRRRHDASSIVDLVNKINAPEGSVAYVEQAMPFPKDGKQGWYGCGFGYGMWVGILMALGFKVVPVRAQAWKSAMGISGRQYTKDDSRTLAMALFPDLGPQLKRKKDHGRADAILIAAFGKGLSPPPKILDQETESIQQD